MLKNQTFKTNCATAGTGFNTLSAQRGTPDDPAFDPAFDTINNTCQEYGANIYNISKSASMPEFIASRIDEGHETSSFLVTNIAPVVEQYNLWFNELPMIHPFYAVKCNPDKVIVRLLASLGCGFDCASQGEIDMVLHGLGPELSFKARGLAESSIVYANPAKMRSHVEFAIANGVKLTVFDGEDELHKLAAVKGHESLQLLLRLKTDDKDSLCPFSKKFGASLDEAPYLLETARSLGLHVAGVSFHVGSGCGDKNAYITAIAHARWVFDAADQLGMPPMHVVDIGGGFPGNPGGAGEPGMPSFQELAAGIRSGIDMFSQGFSRPMSTVRFIAEPGRFFATASTTVVTRVCSRKGGRNAYQALYVDDGVYGSFNNVVYDHVDLFPVKLSSALKAHHQQKNTSSRRMVESTQMVCISEDFAPKQYCVREEEGEDGSSVDSDADMRHIGSFLSLANEDSATASQAGDDDSISSSELQESQQRAKGLKEEMNVHSPLLTGWVPMRHSTEDELIPTAVFGPTCDGLDQMCSLESGTLLPRCEEGDWLVWENMGAYTHTASFVFNGFTHVPQRTYCFLPSGHC